MEYGSQIRFLLPIILDFEEPASDLGFLQGVLALAEARERAPFRSIRPYSFFEASKPPWLFGGS